MDRNGQASAELILIFGGIIVIVMIGLIFYRNYINDLSNNIKDNEVNGLIEKLENINKHFE